MNLIIMKYKLLFIAFFTTLLGWGQVSITTIGTAYTQNFDGMASSATATLPTGYKVNNNGAAPSWTTGTSVTTLAAGTSGTGALTGTSGGGVYNFANGVTASATDRALGFLTSNSFASPNSIILKINNSTGVTVSNLNISFDYEKYRAGTRAWNLTFFHGNTVNPTTAETAGDQAYASDAANAVVNPPTTISKTVNLTGLSIANGTDYYIKWTSTGSGGNTNSQGIAIDNFSITLNPPNNWIGGTGTWNTAGNWSLGAIPSNTDNITISSGSPVLDVDYTLPSGKTLTISGTGGLTINSGKTLTIAGTADFGGKTVIIKSDLNGTGAIGQVTGTLTGATNVTVERYLPAKRGWRLLTAPLKGSSSNTVASNWQGTANEGLLLFSPATYQTQTMTGYTTGGGSPNIWKYNSTSTQWQSIADISTEGLFSSTVNNGFLVFATGPSNSSNIASGSTDTTLKPVGQLITGSVPYSLTANKYYLIGNPYASPLDTEAMVQAHANSKAYMVDPTISTVGGYVTFDGSNWSVLPSGSDKYIQSGQGFFLKSTTGGTFTIAETHKVSGNTNTWFQRTTTDTSADKLRVMLYKQSNSTWQLADGILAVNSASGNDEVDAVDTDKMSNFNENLWFKNGTSNLAIEYRGLPAAGTLQPLQLTGTSAQGYELRIKTENYSNSNLTPYLENTQTGALTAIPTDGSEVAVPFTGIAATSAAPDTRFRIVYQSALHLEDTNSLAVGVYPNPVNEGLFTVVVPQANTPASYTLTNLLGQEVQKGTLLTTNNSIQVQPLTPGVYLLQVNQEGKQFTTKIMIN